MKKFAVSYAPEPSSYSGKIPNTADTSDGILIQQDRSVASDGNAGIADKVASFANVFGARLSEGLVNGDGQFRAMLEALPVAIYATDSEGWITFFNDAAVKFWGRRPRLGESRWCGAWRLYDAEGNPLSCDRSSLAIAVRQNCGQPGSEGIAERPDGTLVPFMAYPTLLRDSRGTISGAVNMLVDISERKQAERHQKTLVDELNHRVKNMLATVQSLAIQTIRNAGVGRDVLRSFDGRLFALGRVHDLLTLGQWQSADFKSVVETVLKPLGPAMQGRIVSDGGSVRLAPREAVLLAMVLHELVSNASKYGALSCRTGTLSVVWRETVDTAGGRSLRIEWQEANGPEVAQPQKQGFGTRLIERGITSELKGSAVISFDPGGVHCSLCIPLASAKA